MFEDDNGYDYHNELDDFDGITCEEYYAEDDDRRVWMDELDRDCDEPYEPGNEDGFIDSHYESQYDLGDDF